MKDIIYLTKDALKIMRLNIYTLKNNETAHLVTNTKPTMTWEEFIDVLLQNQIVLTQKVLVNEFFLKFLATISRSEMPLGFFEEITSPYFIKYELIRKMIIDHKNGLYKTKCPNLNAA